MRRTPIQPDLSAIPTDFHALLSGAQVFDSSCSAQARVLYIDKDQGYYLKSAPGGTLHTEAAMTRYFHGKGLAAEVLAYLRGERDWLLTARVPGEDCLNARYLENPKRLCDTLGEVLRSLHSLSPAGCPVPDRMRAYLDTVKENHRAGRFDASFLPGGCDGDSFLPGMRPIATDQEAWAVVEEYAPAFRSDTLLHGDYCLPNVMLDNWRFSGFIDVGCGGVGDRHIDLFWGLWTLQFNLKSTRYGDRFLDAYGRGDVSRELLCAIAACEAFG